MGNSLCSTIYVLVHAAAICHGNEIFADVSASWNLGDVLSMQMKNQFVWRDGLGKNIKKEVDLTLEQAHVGLNVSIAIERVILNSDCPITKCRVCFGMGKVSAQHTGPTLTQHLTSPCPACNGMGYDTKSCPLLKVEPKVVAVALPPGSRPGYQVAMPGEGNEVVENMKKVVGDLQVSIGTVDSGNFKLNPNNMELLIVMSVKEALNGFVYEEPYVGGRTLKIDRSDKITIPGSKITLKGLGLQKITQPENIGAVKERDDLVVTFELEAEEGDEEDITGLLGKEDDIVDLDGGPTVIKSQDDLDAYVEKQKEVADLKFGRKFLKLLSKFNELEDSSSS